MANKIPLVVSTAGQPQQLQSGDNLVVATQSPLDASTKVATTSYVDSAITTALNDVVSKAACKYATTVALATNVYNNGSSGVGATLTGFAVGALSIDGSTPSVADSVLIKNEATPANNGIYVVTTVGSGIAVYVLTRRSDFNQSADITTGDSTFVTNGTLNASTTWEMSTAGAITVGTTAINFVQASGPLIVVTTTTFASTVTPVGSNSFNVFNSGTQTGNITYAAPSGTPSDGNQLEIRFAIDGTGGYTTTWNSIYVFGTDITASLIPTAASSKFEMKFIYNATDSKWRCVAIARGF